RSSLREGRSGLTNKTDATDGRCPTKPQLNSVRHLECLPGDRSRSYRELQTNQTTDKESNSMLNAINKRRGGFTLVEIMIVVAIIALLAAIAVPGFLRARKRSQASRILNDLRMIDSAVDQYAIETNRKTGDVVGIADWTNYLKKGSLLYNNGKSLLGSV